MLASNKSSCLGRKMTAASQHVTLCILLLASPLAGQEQQVLTVCDILTSRLIYRGKIVTVRGELASSSHGSYLRTDRCPKPLLTEGFVWPNSIHIAQPGSPDVEDRTAKDPTPKMDGESRLLLKKAQSTDRVRVTVTGRFETRLEFVLVQWGDGTVHGYGYGHLNLAPAQLVRYSIGDVEIVKDAIPTEKKR